jgi:hypothetical protein
VKIKGDWMFKKLEKWRNNRNISNADYKVYFGNIIEELLEPLYDKQDVKFIKDSIVDAWYRDIKLDETKVIDTICDIGVFSINESENMGYNFEDSMSETIKEISSRKQDPIQKAEWEANGACGKWKKQVDQSVDTLYTADYSKCKREKR